MQSDQKSTKQVFTIIIAYWTYEILKIPLILILITSNNNLIVYIICYILVKPL